MIRIREIIAIAIVLSLVGSGIWFFNAGTYDNAVGAGGLPLIKANANPAKLPPEDPGGEVMPNADSTVFSAMGIGHETDPSMEGIKFPEKPASATLPGDGDFAGLRTGFAVPVEPETRTESLFDPADYKDTGQSKYFSGLVDSDVPPSEPVVAPFHAPLKVEDAPEEIKTAPQKVAAETAIEKAEKKPDVTATQDPPMPAPITEALPLDTPLPYVQDATAAAKNMEQAEMAAIRPVAKPQTPVSEEKPVEAKPAAVEKPALEEKTVAEVVAQKPKPEDAAFKPAAPASDAPKGYYIQLASAAAGMGDMPAMWTRLKGKYAVALAGLSPVYQTANVTGKGEYVRLQAGPMSQSEANDRCKSLREVDPKGGCLVIKR